MGTSIEIDKRFKVNNKILREMDSLRNSGASYYRIAKIFGISKSTAQYWLDDTYRDKARKKNAKRVHQRGERYKSKKIQEENFTWDNAMGYISKRVNTSKYKDELIFGIPWQYWDIYLKNEWRRGKLKLNR